MGKNVNVPHFNRDTVEYTSRERELTVGVKWESKHCFPFLKNVTGESDLDNFQDLVAAVDASCWLHKAISISVSRFGDDRRCDFGRLFLRRFPGFPVLYMFIFFHPRVNQICSSYLDLHESKNIRPLVVFDGLSLPGNEKEGEQRASWEILHRLTCQFYFSSTILSLYYFANSACLQTLTANKSSFRQREKQTERAEQLQRNGKLAEERKALAAAAEINHDLVCGFIEVSFAKFLT